jgi:hypothetical protein
LTFKGGNARKLGVVMSVSVKLYNSHTLIRLKCLIITPGVKRQGHEVDNSPPFSAEVTNGGAIHPVFHTSSWRGALVIKHRENLTVLPVVGGAVEGSCGCNE